MDWMDKSAEVFEADVADTNEDNGNAYSFDDGPEQMVVVMQFSFLFRLERQRINGPLWLHLLFLVYYQRIFNFITLLPPTPIPLTLPPTPHTPLAPLAAFASITGHLLLNLTLPSQYSSFLFSYQVQLHQLLTKKTVEIRVSFKIPSLTILGKLPSDILGIASATIAGLFTVHEANGS